MLQPKVLQSRRGLPSVQGWRYLAEDAAPTDLTVPAASVAAMPERAAQFAIWGCSGVVQAVACCEKPPLCPGYIAMVTMYGRSHSDGGISIRRLFSGISVDDVEASSGSTPVAQTTGSHLGIERPPRTRRETFRLVFFMAGLGVGRPR